MSDRDYTKLSVGAIRQILVEELGWTEEDAAEVKGKAALIEALEDSSGLSDDADDDFADVEVVEDEVGEDLPDTGGPAQSSLQWSDYVLSQFDKDEEMIKKSPTIDGLRRVAELLIGDIVESTSDIMQCPNEENGSRATVRHRLRVLTSSHELTYDGCADVYWGNCDKGFRNHPVAVAETRAEARALRKLLKLRKVIAAEERATDLPDIGKGGEILTPDKATTTQKKFIDIMCGADKLDLNLKKFVNKYHSDVYNLDELGYSEALALNEMLSSYQSDAKKSEDIPEDIKGYDSNWKNSF